ncbi:hypothetical protein S40285_03150 [Stachybotrys chlorohalonatus IBT 40285]|uniref:Protein kinase C n=1 Tax=Stachybotrys chlorohalonatus (strain IBT 40285) TaxID=1283841 RepID=A0A084QI58_STAC4|nr:hypothetical protein S40285_03150 [Stachybotrys chlorohalonata IBT 40285]
MNDDETIRDILKKIEREKALINAANVMRASTTNEGVRSRLDSQMRDGRRNLQFFEDKLQELQLRRLNQGVDNMSINTPGGSATGSGRNPQDPTSPPAPPPKDSAGSWGEHGAYGPGSYGQGELAPPRHPYVQESSNPGAPKTRPNYTKLDLIKYDTPYLGPRIQLMLSQIKFKLDVETQYLKGVEKMVQLYQMEGDRKSKADAAARRGESKQKLVLLKAAWKRYEELHVDVPADAQDDDSINTPNLRKPLTGQLEIRIGAIKDVDHAMTGRFTRGPETFVAVKVEDAVVGRTRTTRNDRWDGEPGAMTVEKANEVELTVYDKPGEHPVPIAMLWVRISDIVEEMRRKRIEAEMNSSGWVSADRMGNSSAAPPQFPMSPAQNPMGGGPTSPTGPGPNPNAAFGTPGPQPQVVTGPIEGWFNLEPTGQIYLTMKFDKGNVNRKPDAGLGRRMAVRRKDEVHEMYGHKFVQHQFYNIMRCALCTEFLKSSAGMQCEDCKLTCHTKCYTNVVTKCISKSNAETDPDEEKINHRIPHRFQPFSNMTATWCCHCGYMLPFGKKNCRRCVDFCGMSMAVANQILDGIRTQKQRQAKAISLPEKTLRTGPGKMSPATAHSPSPSMSGSSNLNYSGVPTSPEAAEAAKYANQAARPQPDRTSSSSATAAAAAAASAAMSNQGSRQSDYSRYGNYEQSQQSPQTTPVEDPYGLSGHYGPTPQQRKYNPADYVNVNQGYGSQPVAQPAVQARPPQQQPQQPSLQPLQSPIQQQQQQQQVPYQQGVLSQAMQEEFRGFSYTADFE